MPPTWVYEDGLTRTDSLTKEKGSGLTEMYRSLDCNASLQHQGPSIRAQGLTKIVLLASISSVKSW
jgi:hypothetical protein